MILLLAAGLLLVLQCITTFNEILTKAVLKLRLDRILTNWVVPTEVRFIALSRVGQTTVSWESSMASREA